MSWNYRVVRKGGYIGIHEVYYYEESGEISGFTLDSISPLKEDIEDLRTTLEWMKESLDKPILDFEIINQTKKTT